MIVKDVNIAQAKATSSAKRPMATPEGRTSAARPRLTTQNGVIDTGMLWSAKMKLRVLATTLVLEHTIFRRSTADIDLDQKNLSRLRARKSPLASRKQWIFNGFRMACEPLPCGRRHGSCSSPGQLPGLKSDRNFSHPHPLIRRHSTSATLLSALPPCPQSPLLSRSRTTEARLREKV